MGVTYKLKEEVVGFIINQRQANPLASCRQLAESASQKFGLKLSKSSVHDVLKEAGIMTPRGRKPKNKFEIPQEKKRQIQASLSQVKLLPETIIPEVSVLPDSAKGVSQEMEAGGQDLNVHKEPPSSGPGSAEEEKAPTITEERQIKPESFEISAEYDGAGRVFLRAALWDLGIFSEENVKGTDWEYCLTYCKGIKVVLENNKEVFIDLPLPIERCIMEAVDGLINNIRPLVVHRVSDEMLFKSCMDAQAGLKITKILIVDYKDNVIAYFDDIVECKRVFMLKNIVFVESHKKNVSERAKDIFFTQHNVNDDVMDNILKLKGFDKVNSEINIINILTTNSYENITMLNEAAEKLNAMYLHDDQNRLVKVEILKD